jgi:hypothetical protein
MDNLKMKFKLHGLEFEIEGNETTVREEFANFKSFITADLLSKVNIIAPTVTTISANPIKQIEQIQEIEAIEMTDFPAMKEVVKKDLPKTETDWILIYAFYSSKFGEEVFSDKDIKTYYETTGRKNVSRTNNLSNNITSLLKQDYIKVHNDTEYLIKEKGLNYAKQILQGNSVSKSVKRLTNKIKKTNDSEKSQTVVKKTKSNKTNSVSFIDLKLTPAEQKSLNEFFSEKQPKTQNEKVITAMKWFIDDKKVNEVSMEEMNYLLSIAAETPSALAQVLGNMVGAGFRWVTKGALGKYNLSSIGENYVVNKLPKTNK